jgi:hypothetical protein
MPTVDEWNDLCLWAGMFASPEAYHARRDAELQAQLIAKVRPLKQPEPPI